MTGGAWPSVWLARGLVVAGILLAVMAGIPEGYGPPVVLLVVVALGAVAAAFRPDHLALSLTMALVLAFWAVELRSEMPVAVLVAAAGLVVAHVAATLLAYGPPTLRVDPALALVWATRGAMAWVAALVVWAVARAYTGQASPQLFWLTGLTAALVGAVAAGILTPLRPESRT